MRICPNCNSKLKPFDYFFCSNCKTELPNGLYKIPKPNLVNVKLKKEIIPSHKFLIFSIPYENRHSARILFWTILVVIFVSILLVLNYNLNYGF